MGRLIHLFLGPSLLSCVKGFFFAPTYGNTINAIVEFGHFAPPVSVGLPIARFRRSSKRRAQSDAIDSVIVSLFKKIERSLEEAERELRQKKWESTVAALEDFQTHGMSLSVRLERMSLAQGLSATEGESLIVKRQRLNMCIKAVGRACQCTGCINLCAGCALDLEVASQALLGGGSDDRGEAAGDLERMLLTISKRLLAASVLLRN